MKLLCPAHQRDEKGFKMAEAFDKVARWLVFSVALGIIPLVVSAFCLATFGVPTTISHSLSVVVSHGELLIIAALLCGTASGEIVGTGGGYRTLKAVSCGLAIILLLFSALYYADVSLAQSLGKQIDLNLVQTTSLKVFEASLVCSSVCIALGTLK